MTVREMWRDFRLAFVAGFAGTTTPAAAVSDDGEAKAPTHLDRWRAVIAWLLAAVDPGTRRQRASDLVEAVLDAAIAGDARQIAERIEAVADFAAMVPKEHRRISAIRDQLADLAREAAAEIRATTTAPSELEEAVRQVGCWFPDSDILVRRGRFGQGRRDTLGFLDRGER